MSIFVTGTDTGVGKTYICQLMLEALRNRGTKAIGYKPIACGDRDDAHSLAQACGENDLDRINPIHLKTPVSPYVACMLENRILAPAALVTHYHSLAASHETVIVEGIGGWEVPITTDYRVSDFAKELGLPVLLVAANRLGALNHILLTLDAIRAKGLTCIGLVLNQLDDELDTAMITNKGVIEALSGVPLLDHLIHQQNFIDEQVLDFI